MVGPSWWCCCQQNCFVFEDDFNRANSTNIGSDWNEQVGDWYISGNRLHEKFGGGGTASAQCFGTNPVPVDSGGEMYIEIGVYGASVGDKFHIYTCCTSSSSVGTGIKVEFECTAADEWLITITGGGAEGTITQNGDATGGIYVCADTRIDHVTAGLVLSTDEYAWSDNLDPGIGRYYAIGHNNTTNGATFDDFYVTELAIAVRDCTNCVCQCQDWGLKRTLIATVTDMELYAGSTDDFASVDGDTITLEWDFNHVSGVGWYGTWINAADPPGAFTKELKLTCNSDWDSHPDWPGWNIRLSFLDADPAPICQEIDDGICTNMIPIEDESDCDPVSLVYGWIYAQVDVMPPVDISRYKLVFTEA